MFSYYNGLFNRPAPIGYGVTIPQNLTPYFGLGNRFFTTNFGMRTQYNLFDAGYNPMVYHLAQNPQLADTDPLLLGVGGGSSFDDFVKMQDAPRVAQTLATLAAKLESIMKSEVLSDEQKAKIQEKLDKINELKEEFANALKDKSKKAQDIYEIEDKIKTLQGEISELAAELSQEIQNSASNEETPSSNDVSETDNDVETPETTETPDKTDNNKVDDDGKPAELKNDLKESDLDALCSQVYRSVTCVGTDTAKLEEAISALDKTNIVEVIKHWEENYGKHTATGNEGFFAKIFDDIGDDDQKKLVPVMLKALQERAEALGIYDEIKQNVSEINKELASGPSWKKLWCGTWMDDHKLANNLMAIYNKIVAKEAKNAASVKTENAKKKADAKTKADEAKAKKEAEKAEKAKKEEEKVQAAKDLFLSDMREIWKDEEAEVSDKVQYKDGKFVIRIEGKNYEGKDFNELVKNIRAAKLDPEQYLKKQPLKVAA